MSLTSYRKELQLGIASFFLSLLLAEFIFMVLGINKTYVEKRSGNYQSILNEHNTNILRNYAPNSTHLLRSPEFSYERKTNREGFSDQAFQEKGYNILVQTFGDSFTEGDGAPVDSSYPANLKRLLGKGYIIQNYGICGNDPGFYLKQFEKIGRFYHPDIIILSYGTGDFVVDFFSRGGLERFNKDGWSTANGPWWEVIYACSYSSRLIFHAFGITYNDFFLNEDEKKARYKQLEQKWNLIFVEMARLARMNNTKILLFKKPERSEIDQNKYQFDMSFFDSLLVKYPEIHHVDLLPKYRKWMKIGQGGSKEAYYWPKDGHHNSKGYNVMAHLIYESLKEKNLLLARESSQPKR